MSFIIIFFIYIMQKEGFWMLNGNVRGGCMDDEGACPLGESVK